MYKNLQQQTLWRKVARQLCAIALLLFLDCHAAIADATTDRRALVGLNLFRSMLIADQKAESKADKSGKLPVYVLYVSDREQANDYRDSLTSELTAIRDTPADISVISLGDYLASSERGAVGIFISQRLNDEELNELSVKAVSEHVILFSPFEGDVEKGVLGGISVQASVRPYINVKALKKTGIDIKSFYLKVAKKYE